VLTFINVFTVDPRHQARLVELLRRATDEYVRHAPGFVSSRLHRSGDGRKVAMYAPWRSQADYDAMRADPRPHAILAEAMTIATFEPCSYDVVADFAP
jgi:quinol monooxygenase YgiN